MLIAISDDSNINRNENEKISSYKDLQIEVSRVWKVRTEIVAVVIRKLGTIKKGLDQNFQLCPGQSSAVELQVTLMSTAHVIRKCWGKSLWSVVDIRTY